MTTIELPIYLPERAQVELVINVGYVYSEGVGNVSPFPARVGNSIEVLYLSPYMPILETYKN